MTSDRTDELPARYEPGSTEPAGVSSNTWPVGWRYWLQSRMRPSCATTDPTTLLFTSVVVDEVLAPYSPRFLENEFREPDVNKFKGLGHT